MRERIFEAVEFDQLQCRARTGVAFRTRRAAHFKGELDVPLDLQAAFSKTYELGRYARIIDYRERAEPPLSPAEAAWADEILLAAGKK